MVGCQIPADYTHGEKNLPCWPDLWMHLKRLLPAAGAIAFPVCYISLAIVLLWAPKLRTQWKLVASRVFGVLMCAPLIFILPALFFALLVNIEGPPAKTRMIRSPNGQEAQLSYTAGFLGRDYTEITLKRTECCRHTVVFWHQGPGWFDDPKIDWLDNQHLRISYHSRPADRQHCEKQSGDISVECRSSPLGSGLSAKSNPQPPSTHNR